MPVIHSCPMCNSQDFEKVGTETRYVSNGLGDYKTEHYYECRLCEGEFTITENVVHDIEVTKEGVIKYE